MRLFLFLSIGVLGVVSAVALAHLLGLISFGNLLNGDSRVGELQSQQQQRVLQTAQASTDTNAAPSQQQAEAQAKVVARETFGDWIHICEERAADGQRRCAISQQLSDANTKRDIFMWRIAQNGEGGLVSTWITPEGVLLYRGVTITLGTPRPIVVPFETCLRGRCRASANLSEDVVKAFEAAEEVMATIVRADGRSLTLPISVKGLAEGLSALGSSNQQNPN